MISTFMGRSEFVVDLRGEEVAMGGREGGECEGGGGGTREMGEESRWRRTSWRKRR